jgi:hypothetical protein
MEGCNLPQIMGKIFLKFSSKYRNVKLIIEEYFDQIVEQELNENENSFNERTKTSLISSSVNSLEKDKNIEKLKNDEEKKVFQEMKLLMKSRGNSRLLYLK